MNYRIKWKRDVRDGAYRIGGRKFGACISPSYSRMSKRIDHWYWGASVRGRLFRGWEYRLGDAKARAEAVIGEAE